MAEQNEQSFIDHVKQFFVKEKTTEPEVQSQGQVVTSVTPTAEPAPPNPSEIETLKAEIETLKNKPPIQVIAGGMPPTAGMTPQLNKDNIKGMTREQFSENRNAILDAARNKML